MDHAAATPINPRVEEAMRPYFSTKFYNPSATYLAAQNIAKDIGKARSAVALNLGVKAEEIVFTSGGTEANNLAIFGILSQFPGSKVVVSAVEHHSVLRPAQQLDFAEVAVSADGRVDPQLLKTAVDDQTVLVSIMYANNEIGTIQPISKIAQVVQQIRDDRLKSGNKLPLLFHTDACQAANYLDLHASRLGVDMMTLNAGKIYGPKQTGALYVRKGVMLEPIIFGGGQEKGFRSGTENVAGIIGFATALNQVQSTRATEVKRLAELQTRFIKDLQRQLPKTIVNGSLKHRLPNNVHLTFPGQDNERLMMALDEAGIMTAVGSACSASDDEPSHVLMAIGISNSDAQSSLRFTMGQSTTLKDVQRVVAELKKIVN